MKTTFLLILLFPVLSFAQGNFFPVFINQCTNEVQNDVFVTITDSVGKSCPNTAFDKPIFHLNGSGSYTLHFQYWKDTLQFQFDPEKNSRDTFYLPKIELYSYVSSPPTYNYMVCDTNANDYQEDFYRNGQLRKRGTFKDGQLADTLFTYYPNGNIQEILIEKFIYTKQYTYYQNGQPKLEYDSEKRFENTYHENGQLAKKEKWDKYYRTTYKRYYPDGILAEKLGKKRLLYDENGTLRTRMKRKEIMVLYSYFTKEKHFRRDKWYKYTWKDYNAQKKLTRKITFRNQHFSYRRFPDSLEQNSDFLMDKTFFYLDGKKEYKLVTEYLKTNDDHKMFVIVYKRDGLFSWKKEGRAPISEVFAKIEEYTEMVN